MRFFYIYLALLLALVATNSKAAKPLKFKNKSSQTSFENFNTSQKNFKPGYYVVQFKQKLNTDHKALLKSLNIKTYRYIPEDAYLVKLTSGNYKKIRNNKNLEQIVSYTAPVKLSQSFKGSVFTKDKKLKVSIHLIDISDRERIIRNFHQGELLKAHNKILIAELKTKRVYELAKLEGVEWIEPVKEIKLMHFKPFNEIGPTMAELNGDISELTGFESGTKIMNFDSAWQSGFSGKHQTITVADTGFGIGELSQATPDISNLVDGYSYGMFSDSWNDPVGHGTHVAGSVAGNGSLSNGLVRGGAYASPLIIQAMWSHLLETLTVPEKLSELFGPAYEAGSRIHTNSWGASGNFGAYDASSVQVDEFVWDHPDFLVLFAAGNSGVDLDKDGRIDGDSISSPGTAKNALTVGASENEVSKGGIQKPQGELNGADKNWSAVPISEGFLSDNRNGLAMFSSRGPTDDGRVKPDVVAPGTNILSLCSRDEDAKEMWGKFNDDYCFSGGTSMSTPLVAGAAGIVREYLQSEGVRRPTAALIKAILMHTAFDMYPGQYGLRDQGQELLKPGVNNDQGHGRVDVKSALNTENYLLLEEAKIEEGSEFEAKVGVEPNSDIKITLLYTDAPGSPATDISLVNDIDLEVYGDDGQLIEKSQDRINNYERVMVSNLESRVLTIKVKAHKLPITKKGSLPFALIATKIVK